MGWGWGWIEVGIGRGDVEGGGRGWGEAGVGGGRLIEREMGVRRDWSRGVDRLGVWDGGRA